MFDAPADSSPAQPTDTDVLASLTSEQYTEWRKTGNLPDTSTPTDAESAPAEPVEQATSTDVQPEAASEPAKPKKSKTDTRFEELLADRKRERERADRLEREIAELRGRSHETKPAAPSPATAVTVEDAVRKPDISKPILGEDEFFKQFPDATYGQYARYAAKYELAVETAESQQRAKSQSQIEQHEQSMKSFNAKLKERGEADKTFAERLNASELGSMTPANEAMYLAWKRGEPRPNLGVDNFVAQEIVNAEQPADLVEHLLAHGEDLAFLRAAQDIQDLKFRFGRVIERVNHGSVTTEKEKPKTITSAPSPGTYLGQKTGSPADVIQTYVANGDTGSYIDEMNRRELAARTGRK